MYTENKQKLADIAVNIGVNLQKDQLLVINSPVECADFARLVADAAYTAGARDVMVNYGDQRLARLRYDHASLETLTTVAPWVIGKYLWIVDENAAIISIHAEDPTVFQGADASKIQAASNAIQEATEFYSQAISNNDRRWCVISVPTPGWAKRVFPDCTEAEAMDRLWEAIFKTTRTDQPDPIAAWEDHDRNFESKCTFLNGKQFDAFIYSNSLGTNLTVGMPKNHVWAGGSEVAADGISFFPNIPTEEVFCAPHKSRVNGRLVATHPLIYKGQLIDGFEFTFKNGQVVDYAAQVGLDALKNLVEANPGSNFLGEIALVAHHSPISDLNLLFYNTLFDENASCHFALGSAYPSCIEGGTQMHRDQQEAAGLNYSLTHVDFMVGSADLSIIGVDGDGHQTPIFVNGDWAI